MSPTVSAQKIASFDPYFLILFHPLMIEFDQSVHRFLKKNDSSLSKIEWNIQREKLLRELRGQRQTQQNKSIAGFYAKLPDLKRRFPSNNDYNREYQKLRSVYLGVGEVNHLNEEYSKFYHNDKESLEIFSRIWRDIRVVMAQLQQENEYLFYLPIYKEKSQVVKKPYNLKFSGANLGVSDYLGFSLKSKQVQNADQVENHLNSHFKNIEKTKALLYPYLKSKFVLYGLEDVSEILLKKVLQRNKVPIEITEIVGNVYNAWLTKKQVTAKETE